MNSIYYNGLDDERRRRPVHHNYHHDLFGGDEYNYEPPRRRYLNEIRFNGPYFLRTRRILQTRSGGDNEIRNYNGPYLRSRRILDTGNAIEHNIDEFLMGRRCPPRPNTVSSLAGSNEAQTANNNDARTVNNNEAQTLNNNEAQTVNNNNVQDISSNNNDDVILVQDTRGFYSVIDLRTPQRHDQSNGNNGIVIVNDESPVTPVRPALTLTCPICLKSSAKRRPTSTICGHIFCLNCITMSLRVAEKCPLCNKGIKKEQLIQLYID